MSRRSADPVLYRGTTSVQDLVARDLQGAVIDLTGATVSYLLGTRFENPYLELELGAQLEVLDAAAGTVRRTLTPEQTQAMPTPWAVFELIVTKGDLTMAARGRLKVADTLTAAIEDGALEELTIPRIDLTLAALPEAGDPVSATEYLLSLDTARDPGERSARRPLKPLLDAKVSLAGDTMTGTLGVAAATAAGHAVRKDQLDAGLDLKAPLESPDLTGTPTAPTATDGDHSTKVATTDFVQTAVAPTATLAASFSTRIGAVEAAQSVGAAIGYTTKALMDADLAHAAGALALVTNDPQNSNNRVYVKSGASGTGSWVAAATDRVDALDVRLTGSVNLVRSDLNATGLRGYIGTSGVHPIVVDSEGRIIFGIDRATGDWSAGGLLPVVAADAAKRTGETLTGMQVARFVGDGDIVPFFTDAAGRVLLGFNRALGQLIGALPSTGAAPIVAVAQSLPPLPTELRPLLADINGLIFYGQSLSVGGTGQPALSLTQPYANLTFVGGPRSSSAQLGSTKALVEDDNVAPDGGTNRGETPCSGAANAAVELLAIEDGVSPASHVILTSTAGKGAATMAELEKGSAWYPLLTDHITAAHALAVAGGDSYRLHAFGWLQGEANVGFAQATYQALLADLQADIEADAQAITGQTTPVFCITYQLSYRSITYHGVAAAQLALCQANDRFVLATPFYHLPHAGDGTHLTNVGYLLIGRYYGRAYKRLVLDGVRPGFINPVSATLRARSLTINFDVPVPPLVLDDAGLAPTTDRGFRVVDSIGTVPITSVAVLAGSKVLITLEAAPVGATVVRYALDYLGTGLVINEGASGNLRDSEPDSVAVAGTTYPLFNVCPHFELNVIPLA